MICFFLLLFLIQSSLLSHLANFPLSPCWPHWQQPLPVNYIRPHQRATGAHWARCAHQSSTRGHNNKVITMRMRTHTHTPLRTEPRTRTQRVPPIQPPKPHHANIFHLIIIVQRARAAKRKNARPRASVRPAFVRNITRDYNACARVRLHIHVPRIDRARAFVQLNTGERARARCQPSSIGMVIVRNSWLLGECVCVCVSIDVLPPSREMMTHSVQDVLRAHSASAIRREMTITSWDFIPRLAFHSAELHYNNIQIERNTTVAKVLAEPLCDKLFNGTCFVLFNFLCIVIDYVLRVLLCLYHRKLCATRFWLVVKRHVNLNISRHLTDNYVRNDRKRIAWMMIKKKQICS